MSSREFGVSTEVSGLDTERILRTLNEHGVQFVLIGGLAALVHGSTLATADADVLPEPGPENLERLLDALMTLDAQVLVAEQRLAMESAEPWEVTELRRGAAGLEVADAWHFTTSAGPIDVVMQVTGVGRYHDHLSAAVQREVFGLVITVAGAEQLIASKEAIGRPKDVAVIRELRDLSGEE